MESLDHISSIFNFFEEPISCFPQKLYQCASPPTRVSFFHIFPQHLLFVVLCFYNQIFHCSFDSQFSGDVEHLFQMPVGHLFIFFGKMSIHNQVFFFLSLNCRHVLWIFWILTPSSDILFANVFSHAVSGRFILCGFLSMCKSF